MSIIRKHVGEMVIASICFLGERADIPGYFEQLDDLAGTYQSGPAFCLFHHDSPEIEVCFPVWGPVTDGPVRSRVLPGGAMLSLAHTGPYDTLRDSWQTLMTYVREREITLSNDPSREIYLEGPDQHGDDAAEYITELQTTPMLPRWLDRLARGLDQIAGPDARQHVMAGSEALTVDSPGTDSTAWLAGALNRLDASLPDDEARYALMAGCTHRFPASYIAQMRAEYERCGSVDEVIRLMAEAGHFPPIIERKGNVLYTQKAPANPAAYEAATDPVEKRAAACFCGLIRAAIRSGTAISRTHCYCGAGWSKQVWEGILGQTVHVELLESVLQGDDRCYFAIHLPPGVG